MTTTAKPLSSILKWIWDEPPKFMSALQKAVDENDVASIQTGREKLESELKKLDSSTHIDNWGMDAKYKAAKTELEAKIATVVAIQNGKSEDWTAASAKYDELSKCFKVLASSCCYNEDIAKIMFKCDAEEAAKYAAACMAKAKGDTPEAPKELVRSEAKSFVDRIGPSLGCDFTYDPVYPKDRKDVCAIRRLAENGTTYGFDTLYLIWKDNEGNIQHRELAKSRDYLHISEVIADDDNITVKCGSGGCFGGKLWSEEVKTKVAQAV